MRKFLEKRVLPVVAAVCLLVTMVAVQHGPHGYSLADETTADGSSQVLNPSFAHWHELSVDWLYRVFGQLTFGNESTSRMAKYMAELGLLPGQPSGADFA